MPLQPLLRVVTQPDNYSSFSQDKERNGKTDSFEDMSKILTFIRAQMGRSLLGQSPLVRSVLEECEDALKQLPNGPSWSLIEELCKPPEESNVNEAEYAQPLCTALQIGLVSLLRSWDVRPGAVVGHSSGEIAAAFAAGIISLRVAIITAYYRGLLFAGSSGWPLIASRGSMCAVGASEDECMSLEESSKGLVQLAAINSPRSCTLSGNRQAIQDVVNVCAKKGQFCRLMKVDRGDQILDHKWPPIADHDLSVPFASHVGSGTTLRTLSYRGWNWAFQEYTSLHDVLFSDRGCFRST